MTTKRSLTCCVLALSALMASAGEKYPELPLKITDETAEAREARMAWWRHDRFGMFIHFGLYACPARHEWVKSQEAMDDETYDGKYLEVFDPDLFDARTWARTAKAAGMKYIVLTAKHHEGFCMWDTKTTDYKVTKTDFGRDLVGEYVKACREEGLKVGLYYSVIDWHHPDYTVGFCHPTFSKFTKANLKGKELRAAVDKANAGRDMARYRAYLFAQVRELLSNYGKIDIIWFDFTPSGEYGKTYRDWDAVNLVKMARELQPGIIMDDRLDLRETDDGWDFVSPEQFKVAAPPKVRGREVPWETCQTFSGSWGYYRDEETWKSVPQLIELLVHSVSKGGNLILNVGPTARGEFDGRARERLAGIGDWMRHNARAIYGCGPAPADIRAPEGTLLTYNAARNRLYVHILNWPMGRLPVDFEDRIRYAQFLHDGSELFVKRPPSWQETPGVETKNAGFIELPVRKPAVEVPVVEILLK